MVHDGSDYARTHSDESEGLVSMLESKGPVRKYFSFERHNFPFEQRGYKDNI